VNDRYRNAADLPDMLPVFPLRGAILLPRATLTLNVFEPRYLALIEHTVGCAGRITAFDETEDGRMMISLFGVARFTLGSEIPSDTPFRMWDVDFSSYADDFISGHGEDAVDRPRLLETLRSYLEANNLSADWERINSATNERLVNTLAILSPYGPEEKQALLQAKTLPERAEALVALAEMELASRDDGSGTSIQ